MLAGVVLLLGGSLGAELFTSRFSLLVLLAGMVLFLGRLEDASRRFVPPRLPHLHDPDLPTSSTIRSLSLSNCSRRASRHPALELIHVPVLREGNVLISVRTTPRSSGSL